MLTALFGGTFDPIHYGHLLPIVALAKDVQLTHIYLVPNQIPPHKPKPNASTEQRLTMLHLATEDMPLFSIDTREISRNNLMQPSYTIETLKSWRQENGEQASLAFILGQDALLNLAKWHDWQHLLNYCHLLVCQRPGYLNQIDDSALKAWIDKHHTKQFEDLHRAPNGYIYFAHTPLEDISASEIRELIRLKKNCHHLLPTKVWQYIQQQGLYETKKS